MPRFICFFLSCCLSSVLLAQVARPAYNTGTGFFVIDSTIYDPAGYEFVPMGYNAATFWANEADCKRTNMSVHIPASGANAVRIVTQTQGAFGWNANPTEQRDLVDRAVQAQVVPMLEMHNATCSEPQFQTIVDYWTSPAMVQLCQDYEEYLWVNIANEHNFPTALDWRDTYISTIQQFRQAGIKNLIVVDAGKNCGQNPEYFQYANEVLAADPQQNVVFSIHMYGFWRTLDRSFTNWTPPFVVENDLPALREAGFPVVVGEFGWDSPSGYAGNYDAETILQTADSAGIGWFFWSFFDTNDKPYYSVLNNVCHGLGTANLTPAGQYLIPYLQQNAQPAEYFNLVSQDAPQRGLRLFPNPLQEQLRIEGLTRPARLEVWSLEGQLLRTDWVTNGAYDLSFLPRGMYLLRLQGQAVKVVKQ